MRRRPRVRLEPLQSGGGQERGLRSGTVPTPLAVGLGTACEIAQQEMEVEPNSYYNAVFCVKWTKYTVCVSLIYTPMHKPKNDSSYSMTMPESPCLLTNLCRR